MEKGHNERRAYPWKGKLSEEMKEGSIIKGRVIDIKDYGVLLEVLPGVEGLILVPEVSWSYQPISTKEYFHLNQEYHAKIIFLDRKNKRMYLSIKQMTEDPWRKIKEKYPLKSCHTGVVRSFTPYGVFVVLEYGVGGMILLSDLSYPKKYFAPSEFIQIGQRIKVTIQNIDLINRKLILGFKKLISQE